MRKSLFGIAAVAALAGIVLVSTNLKAAAPKVTKPAIMKAVDNATRRTATTSQSAAAGTALNYSTGFEAAQGFTARGVGCDAVTCPHPDNTPAGGCGFIGDGTQGSGAYPEPWGVSSSNAADIEGHVDTIHPFAGTQHLRISKDLCDSTNAFSFAVDARVPPSPPQPGIIAPSTYSGQISIPGLFGASVNWQPQSNSQGFLTSRVMFFFYGFFYILDDPGTGITFVPVFTYWDATGTYQNITVHHDPCAKFICLGGANSGLACPNGTSDCKACVGGANDGLGCVGGFQCPGGSCDGGTCTGRVDYSYGGNLIYQGTTYAGTTSEQFLIYTDNFGGDNDLDDLSVQTGAPCPTVCGNQEIEAGEQCDGANDDGCPGACVGAGQTGPGGEAECTCIIPALTCDTADAALNGTNNAIAHGQWWTFTAETPAYGIDLCGSAGAGFDSYLIMWTGTCNTLQFLAANDDCDSSTAFGPGSDPLASCFDRGGPGSVGAPYESCTCIATTAGQQYWATVYGADAPGHVTNLTLDKRLTCGALFTNGACTDCLGNCVDDVAQVDCTGTWVQQKLCATDAAPATCGACCDAAPGLGGACAEQALPGDCVGADQTFSLALTCADITCNEVTGACCNGIDGTCSVTLQADCTGQSRSWTKGAACSGITCSAVPGACCNHINPDPLSLVGVCTDGVISADCAGADMTWSKATICSAVTCDATFQAIPTVSEWGLVVLTLLLLVGAKVYFGRREGATA